MASERKTGSSIPAGILQPTTPREPEPTPRAVDPDEGQGGDHSHRESDIVPGGAVETRPPRVRRSKKPGPAASEKLEGRRLYLSESVHFRLRMLAYQRGQKLSEAAEDILDRALPKWDVNRVG